MDWPSEPLEYLRLAREAWQIARPGVLWCWRRAVAAYRKRRAVGWKELKIAIGDPLMTAAQTAVADAHLVDAARRKEVRADFALFSRTVDDGEVMLLSPAAAEYLSHYPGAWSESSGPGDYEWAGLYFDTRSYDLLGVRQVSSWGDR